MTAAVRRKKTKTADMLNRPVKSCRVRIPESMRDAVTEE